MEVHEALHLFQLMHWPMYATVQLTVTKPCSSATTGIAVVLDASTTKPDVGFLAPDEGWKEEVSMSMGKVTIDHRACASL